MLWGRSQIPRWRETISSINSNARQPCEYFFFLRGCVCAFEVLPQKLINHHAMHTRTRLAWLSFCRYTDEGSAWWWIKNNVVQGAPFWLSVWTPTIHDEVIEFCYTDTSRMVMHGTNITVRNITLVTNNQWPAEAVAIMQQAGIPWAN